MAALSAIGLLKSGDLVLFAGPESWLGRLPWLRRAAWTHVGLVLRRAGDLEPLLWETQDGLHRSATMAPLAARIARFSGRIGARCLNRPLEGGQCERLEALRRDLCRPAEHGLLDLIAAADDGWLGAGPEHLGEPTDAELVATVYQGLGLLDDIEAGGRAPSRFRPRHFAGGYGLELKNGYALGPEIVLQEPADGPGWSDFRPQPA
ncbi:MAG: hypothetical protein ACREJ0_20400 [Geminicoccaceae bacterium]